MHSTATKLQGATRKRRAARATIMVVEDDRFVREVTGETLRNAGYHVVAAECALAAAEVLLCREKRIHLLLCDAVLPDSSGAVLSRSLRRRWPELKVIVASGYPQAGLPPGRKESAGEFLAKPYDAASLIAKVQSTLRAKCESAQVRGR